MVVVVTTRLLKLREGLLGPGEITGLQGLPKGRQGIHGRIALAASGSGRTLRGRELLEGCESRLGTFEVALLKRLTQLIKQRLALTPLALLG